MSTITLYHYTSEAGARGIVNAKKIKASKVSPGGGDDGRYGEGVYFTSIAPDDTTKLELLLNNYDGSMKRVLQKVFDGDTGKIAKAIMVELPTDIVKRVRDVKNIDRDILMVADDVDLNKYEFEIVDGPDEDIDWGLVE